MAPIIFPGQPSEGLAGVFPELLARLAGFNLTMLAGALGADYISGALLIPSFGRVYRVSGQGIVDQEGNQPSYTHAVVLAYYVLHGGTAHLTGKWVSYRDFKDSAFFMPTFQEMVERRIAREFQGELKGLRSSAARLGGRDYPELGAGDLCLNVPALPKVPLLLIFHDGDEEFPASATVLYDFHSAFYLDVECLGVLGAVLADKLLEEKVR